MTDTPDPTETCRPVYDPDSGELLAVVRGSEPLGSDGEAAMRELVAAARRKHEADHPEEYTVYETDSDALAWARAKVQRRITVLRTLEDAARERGEHRQAAGWAQIARYLERHFLGGNGPRIAAFDERRATRAPEAGGLDA